MIALLLVALLGIIICFYGLFIEKKIKENKLYKAACDLSDRISCSKTFLTPYANLLGISNIYVGLMFYGLVALLALLKLYPLIFIVALIACAVSIYFAYIQYVKIRVFCLLCTCLYIINLLILILSYYRY